MIIKQRNSKLPFSAGYLYAEAMYKACSGYKNDPAKLTEIKSQVYGDQPIIFQIEEALTLKLISFTLDHFAEVNTLLILIWSNYRSLTNQTTPQISGELYDRLLKLHKVDTEEKRRLDEIASAKHSQDFIDMHPTAPLYSLFVQKIFMDYSSVFQPADKNHKHILLIALQVLMNCFEEVTRGQKNTEKQRPRRFKKLLSIFRT
jgi:hypothetical protein